MGGVFRSAHGLVFYIRSLNPMDRSPDKNTNSS